MSRRTNEKFYNEYLALDGLLAAKLGLARGGVTDSSAYAMFNVRGDVELPSAMTFLPLSLPDSNYAALISGIAQSTTAWTVGDGASSKWKVNSTANGIAMSKPGMSIVIR